ncbi:MAG: hypothetical protein RIS76_4421 [Verrucomicrobiota bacterium]
MAVNEDGTLFASGRRLGSIARVFPTLSRWDTGRSYPPGGLVASAGGMAGTHVDCWDLGTEIGSVSPSLIATFGRRQG